MPPLRSLLPRRSSQAIFFLVLLLTTGAFTLPALADYRDSGGGYCCPNYHQAIRPGDEIYLVSTRCLPGGCGYQLPVEQMSVMRYDGEAGWLQSSIEEATADAPVDCTSIFVHGNWMDRGWAKRRGWAMYHEVTRDWTPDRHIRYIIWSWPTTPNSKSLASIRRNNARADAEAYYLGWFLSQLPAEEKVSLSAFSLGASVVTGALRLQAGGVVVGRSLEEVAPRNCRVVFFAGATPTGSFSPYCYGGDAMSRVERFVNYYNSSDPALKRFWMLEGRGVKAMGYTGAGGLSSEGWAKTTQYNVSCIMGREHDWNLYACNRCIMDQSREVLRFEEILMPATEPVVTEPVAEEADPANAEVAKSDADVNDESPEESKSDDEATNVELAPAKGSAEATQA
ncbi:hypothetical protein Enr8_47390 [Blastopirellula retiformator]|uniref:Alpha/beta hydrolase family protein n=1 Tax=Blastopirellula retiformator TaxID=2527970 RepID=A0A5C5UXB0_9BACT|nr:hypothetical protein Enr8_47390 [Blastopirellula retiformator]